MSKRDYYDILGVTRSADRDAIKKAYRQLARKWHPDVNKSEDAQKRFSEIQEAYDVLSDEEKRKQYDRFGHVGVGAGSPGTSGPGGGGGAYSRSWDSGSWGVGGGGPGAGGADIGSIFEELFGGGRRQRHQTEGGGSPFGFDPRAGATRGANRAPRPGEDLQHVVEITFNTAIRGGKEHLRFSSGDQSEVIDVTIPPGVEDGTKLRIRGKGHPGAAGGTPGDLILTVRVGKHPYYRRDGLNILLDVPITIAEAVLGTTVTVPTIKGQVGIKIPAGAQPGQKLRIPKHGIVGKDGATGDFHAVINVVIPTDLSESDVEAVRSLGSHLPSPRTGAPWE